MERLSIKPLLFALFGLVLLTILVNYRLASPTYVAEADSAQAFSSEQALKQLEFLTQEQQPHSVDSRANRLVEARIVEQLKTLNYQPEVQDQPICGDYANGLARCTRVRNIVVHIPGSHKGKGILLSAHYDSVPAGPGVSDAGVAVASLLEIARLLHNQPQARNSITLLFNEGEEFGLFGAKAFMQYHPLAKQIQLALNIEARGTSGQSVMFETGEDSGWLVDHYARTTPAPLSSSLFYEVYKILPNDTDLSVYKKQGLQGLNFAHAENEAHYHTPLDNLENLDKSSLKHHGENVWGVLQQIKETDLQKVQPGNLVYTDILGTFIVSWQESSSPLFAMSLCIIYGLLLFLFIQKHLLKFSTLIKHHWTIWFLLFSALGSAFVLQKLVEWLSSSPEPWYANPLPMQIAVWLSVLFFGINIGRLLTAKISPLSQYFNLLLFFVVIGLVISVSLPGLSFLFLIPSFIGLIGILFWLLLHQKFDSLATPITLYIFLFGNAIIFIPIAHLLAIMVSFKLSISIGFALGFVLLSLLPFLAIRISKEKYFTYLNTVLLVGIISSIGWVSIQSPYSALAPKPENIYYLQDKDNQHYILTGFTQKILPENAANQVQNSSQQRKMFWSNTNYQTILLGEEYQPALAFTSPQINISQLSLSENSQMIELMIDEQIDQLSDIKLYIPVESKLESITYADHVLRYSNEKDSRNGYFEFHCRGDSCSQMQLSLKFLSNSPGKIIVAKILAGLPKSIAEKVKKPGGFSTPRHAGDQSIILKEVEI